MQLATTFLPDQCPLATHVVTSYKKHHLGPWLEQTKKIKEDQRNLDEVPEEIINRFKTKNLVKEGVTTTWNADIEKLKSPF